MESGDNLGVLERSCLSMSVLTQGQGLMPGLEWQHSLVFRWKPQPRAVLTPDDEYDDAHVPFTLFSRSGTD